MEIELVALLRAAWVAATLPILVASIPSSLLNSFHEFFLGFAKRGKIMQSSSQVEFCGFLGGRYYTDPSSFCGIEGSLRKKPEQANEYVIPHGDWFDYVSCPHYLAELVIYAGLMVANGGADLTVWLIFGFVVANLVLAAAETHKWYLHKFDSYPRSRFAIVPFVF
ncbi:unnamed protein product [Camellia sinensis]